MGSVISVSQTAFVKGRQILDGILIANEVVDEARKSKKELLLFKVDFEKAYDSVDWVNGSPADEFPLERGLRQGDSLSPFLFLMAAEGLHVLMEAMVERDLFTGYSVGEIAPVSVSHLQFADDTLLMGTKCWANVRALRAVLVLFESMSGLRVNFHKSLLVGVNIPDSWLGRYGVERGRLCEGGARGSTWWREMARIWDGGGELGGGWFREHVSRKVRDGSDTFFWTDPWVDGISLRERFGRLFDLAENKSALVAEMFMQGWGIGGAAWDHVPDRWKWQSALDDVYTVRCAYQLLTTRDAVTLDDASGLIWHRQVPLKVSICAWRLLQDRLPTKANLVTRGILFEAGNHCVSGCGEVETAQHLFLSCSTFGVLWSLVSSWIDSSLVTAQTIPDHFVQFTYSTGGLRARRSFIQLIWLAFFLDTSCAE
ncbi:uncharacterized protein LOC123922177 [Trifolium pratense]|uniref:uncharacterized protein LOC123922177 n=1 Tax=Trifolium pratense TaxID=57577 RepID=UPI001E691CD5|nr:uncharacterized protein LOC123922177 [Trifolium pratense]